MLHETITSHCTSRRTPKNSFPRIDGMFAPLPDKPDHDALEREVLELWEREETFRASASRTPTARGSASSTVRSPRTRPSAVHTAWGRTLKDVFQRYKALRGYHQRYQNGFDCQGLWIEVGVERELGLNSKREIEEFGLAEFARRCREVVERSSADADEGLDPARPVDGLGPRLLHVLRHEHRVHLAVPQAHPRARLALPRPPLDGVVPALRHVALAARARPGSSSRTARTPRSPSASRCSTAPAQSLVDLDDDAVDAARQRRGRRAPRRGVRPARERRLAAGRALPRRDASRRSCRAPSSSASATRGPFDAFAAGRRRRAPRHRLGRGLASRRARASSTSRRAAAPRTSSSSQVHDLPMLTPVDESGRFYDDYGWLHGLSTGDAADQIVGDLAERGLLVARRAYRAPLPALLALRHAPHLPHLRRLVPRRRRDPPADARRERDGGVDARVHGQAHGRLARQHGRLEHLAPALLRPAAALLPVRVRPPHRRSARRPSCRAGRPAPLDGLEELRRPWVDAVRSAARRCGEEVERIAEVGDVWLDAGIVPFSTLGWESPEYVREGYATGAAKGLTRADLPDHAYWEEWFPADWVSEMREQIRLWFYSQLFMSVALTGRRRSARCSATRRCSTRPAARCTARGGT